ncbi:hypothetical protein HD806DRAFT_324290 [Xylariaceae sp. AK1471]|nr:hypothetical protein HD806DRAFT_324290 [Xylariaceae sp. AK1471]
MTSLYDLTFPTLISALKAEQGLLTKAEAFAAEKGIDIEEILNFRLAPDMWPFSQQIVITTLHAAMAVQKLTGTPANKINFGPAPLADCKKYLAETLELVQSVKPETANGKEAETVKAQLGQGEVPMKAINYVQGYLIPNVFFHLTTVYDILRLKGLSIGKADFISTFVKVE